MQSEKTAAGVPAPHRIELSLRDVNRLFNTMDPSPFHEKDLDHDAEEFILSWAMEFPVHEPVTLVLHLGEGPCGPKERGIVEQAVHHYFAYRARLNQLEFRQLVGEGRRSLMIGLIFLGVCLCISEALSRSASGTMLAVLRESLTIGGWVAMWRPMEIHLYDLWPQRRRGKIFEKLSRMPVEVQRREQPSPAL